MALRFDQLVELAQLDEAPRVRLDGGHDVRVVRVHEKRADGQLAGRHVLAIAENLDLLVDVAELHPGIALDEALAGDESAASHRDVPLEVDDRGGRPRVRPLHEHELPGLEALDALLGAELVGKVLHLLDRIPTHDFLPPALCR